MSRSIRLKKRARDIISSMTIDRSIGFNVGSSILNQTFDEFTGNWEYLHVFQGAYTNFIKELANGELLVSTQSKGRKSKLWLSDGYRRLDKPRWNMVLEAHSNVVKWVNWSIFCDNNLVLLIDYGGKAGMKYGDIKVVPDGDNARYAYMSLDYGKTWKKIFDLNEWVISNGYYTLDDRNNPQARGVHCHGIAYDKYWDRIWITFGDNSSLKGINSIGGTCYSDNLGRSWRSANWGKDSKENSPSNSVHQLVGIYPMKDCILFGTDCAPNGIHRIERSQGKSINEEYIFNVAYAYNNSLKLSHLCQSICQAHHLPDQYVYFGFSTEGQHGTSFVVATKNGFDFVLLWEAQIESRSGRGLRHITGPTRSGNIIITTSELESGKTQFYEVKVPALY